MLRFLSLTCLLVAVFFNTGCGTGGPTTFDVKGTVTFDGKPVPAGRIDFFPDLAKNNDGPQGFAFIKNGVFDTRLGGQGHTGGPVIIRIEGFDGKSDDPRFLGNPIFVAHQIHRDMPKEATTEALEVPASAAVGLVIPTGPRS